MKKQLVAIGVWLLGAAIGQAQPVSKTLLRLPDTGQTGNYTPTFGEDADYSIHPPFFVNHGNGTVTDTVTGLMWQQTDGGEMTFEVAQQYCAALTLGGHDDWRLPTAHEGFSILNQGTTNPALSQAVFGVTTAEYWWTSDAQANDPNRIWVTNAGGGIGNHPKSETLSAGGSKRFHVRAVRDVQAPEVLTNHFTDNGDGTVTDHLTGLVWQQTPLADTLTWEQALNYAEALSLAGHDDWRLPNIKELHSLNDETRVNPSVNTAFFATIGVKKYWASTSLPNQTSRAWYFDTRFGITTYDLKTRRLYLICVRGPEEATTSVATAVGDNRTRPEVFPNPFSSTLGVKWPVGAEESFELRDALGRVVATGTNRVPLDCTGLTAGVYWLVSPTRQWAPVRVVKI